MDHYTINGTGFKNPSSFKKDRFKITNLERLANADMAGDLIARKRKFYFTYDSIEDTDWQAILDLIWEADLFFTLGYTEFGEAKTAMVYVGDIPAELHRMEKDGKEVYKNVTFNLIEK